MRTKEYNRFNNLKHMTLESLYEGNTMTLDALDYNILGVVECEAPVTLSTLKARLREAFDTSRIRGGALDIILERINSLDLVTEDEIFDTVIWPKSGKFKVDYLRVNSDRLIYDIPACELKNLVVSFNLDGEELKRKVLEYFGTIRLTEKADEYINYVLKY